jgi:squalene synthase HpnC
MNPLLGLILQQAVEFLNLLSRNGLSEINRLNIQAGYKKALSLARSHYENFPVVSLLIPKTLRNHLSVIYWFARTADDLADEGSYSDEERFKKISVFEERLNNLLEGYCTSELESALAETIKTKNLSPQHFYNLLKAFKQDVMKKRYSDFNDVLSYCENSANPVGRLILELLDLKCEKVFYYSDKICTALQITNFIQDASLDFKKGRIYFPLDEMQNFGVTEKMFELKENNINFNNLVEFNIVRTQQMFDEGKNLLRYLKGRIKFEIIATIKGGELILRKIREQKFDVLNIRPVLSKADYFKLPIKSVFSL